MMVKCEDYDHVSVIALQGELVHDTLDAIKKQFDHRIDNKMRFFVLDLQNATFIDSKGLELLLWMQEQCDERLGQLRLCNPDENCRKILHVTRLEGRFDIFEDVSEAVKTMR